MSEKLCVFWKNSNGAYGYGKPYSNRFAQTLVKTRQARCHEVDGRNYMALDSYGLELELTRLGVDRQTAHRLALENFREEVI